MEKLNISLNMIVKDSAKSIERAIRSFKNIVTEIVVIDTGSKDNTIALAQNSGAKVYSFEWINSFSAARNYAIEKSQCPWIFWLDDDEWIDEESGKQLLETSLSLEHYYYLNKVIVRPRSYRDFKTNCVRLFPNRPDVRWRYRIHEDILKSLKATNLSMELLNIDIRNDGSPPHYLMEKGSYYKKYIEEDLKEWPEDPYLLFHHGQECRGLKQFDLAEESLRKSLLYFEDDSPYLTEVIPAYVHALIETDQLTKAIDVIQLGRSIFPNQTRLIDYQAIVERFLGNPERAEALWKELIDLSFTPSEIDRQILNSVGVRLAAYDRLGDLYFSLNKFELAHEYWNKALAIDPQYIPALDGLKKINRTG